MSASGLRTLKLKTGVVHRTAKELISYRTELAENRSKIEEIRQGPDKSMLRQWENVALETQGMIPDTAGRLTTAVEDLQILVDDCEASETSTDEYKAAMLALETANSALKDTA